MQLTCRQPIGNGSPILRIGRRTYRGRDGIVRQCRVWWAEWCWKGKTHAKSLKAVSEQEAVRVAHALRQSILAGEPHPCLTAPLTWKRLTEGYCLYQRQRDHAPKTLEKYELVFRTLIAWAEAASPAPPARFAEPDY